MGNLLRDRDVLPLFVHLPEPFSVHKGGMLIENLEPFAFIPLAAIIPVNLFDRFLAHDVYAGIVFVDQNAENG